MYSVKSFMGHKPLKKQLKWDVRLNTRTCSTQMVKNISNSMFNVISKPVNIRYNRSNLKVKGSLVIWKVHRRLVVSKLREFTLTIMIQVIILVLLGIFSIMSLGHTLIQTIKELTTVEIVQCFITILELEVKDKLLF